MGFRRHWNYITEQEREIESNGSVTTKDPLNIFFREDPGKVRRRGEGGREGGGRGGGKGGRVGFPVGVRRPGTLTPDDWPLQTRTTPSPCTKNS